MRFHLGFSKSIKTKTLIKFFIALGVLIGVRLMLGFTPAYAWTLVNTNSSNSSATMRDYFYSIKTVGLNSDEDRVEYESLGADCFSVNSDSNNMFSKYWLYSNCSGGILNDYAFLSSFTQASTKDYSSSVLRGITYYRSYNLLNNNYCTSDSSNKSINIKGSYLWVTNSSSLQNLSFFNKNVNTMFYTSIFGKNLDNSNLIYGTPCTTTLESTNSTYKAYYYSFTCNNVKVSSDIDYYEIFVDNYYTDLSEVFPTSGNKNMNGALYFNITNSSTSYNVPSLQYECSTDDANVLTPPVENETLEQFYDDARENFNNNRLPNGMVSYLHLPNSISDLATLPINFLQLIFENGDNACTDYEINFSSIASTWLGSNFNSNDYKIKLPCMRNLLSTLLGSLYTLADTLLACLVFYSIAKHIFVFCDLITEGEDLYSYYFSSDDDNIQGHKPNAYVNNKTGEVIQK